MPTTISLVMTVYDRQKYLPQAVDSILAQTYPHWHLTIWDDGSTDASAQIGRQYALSDARIRFVSSPTNMGQQHALRTALANARGQYIGWVDSDDLLAPDALAATVEILDTHPNMGMVYTDHVIIDEASRFQGIGFRCHIPYSKDRMLIDFMTFHFRLMRREMYDRVGGIDLDSYVKHVEDYDICLKLAEVTEIYHLQQPLYYYREHSQSISQSNLLKQIENAGNAINNALVRRGLADRYYLNILPTGQFQILERSDISTPPE
jgi:glycosyltransferase involved in cell wall biosynthesis